MTNPLYKFSFYLCAIKCAGYICFFALSICHLQVLNLPQHTGRFNFTTQFPYYKEVLYKPDFQGKKLGKNVVFDMDMSAGDFLALFYLLKLPVEVINLKVNWFPMFSIPLA